MSIIKRSPSAHDEAPDASSTLWEVDRASLSDWILSHGGRPSGDLTAPEGPTASEEPTGLRSVPVPIESGPATVSVVTAPRPGPPDAGEEFWVEELEAAVGRAHRLETAEAWRAVAGAAGAVSEIAEVMEHLAEATTAAAEKAVAADEAALAAARLAVHAEDARRNAEEMGRLAHEAETTAQRARREATEAEEAAARLTGEVPAAEQAAHGARQDSIDARERAEAFAAAVSRARQANSAEGWAEARGYSRSLR